MQSLINYLASLARLSRERHMCFFVGQVRHTGPMRRLSTAAGTMPSVHTRTHWLTAPRPPKRDLFTVPSLTCVVDLVALPDRYRNPSLHARSSSLRHLQPRSGQHHLYKHTSSCLSRTFEGGEGLPRLCLPCLASTSYCTGQGPRGCRSVKTGPWFSWHKPPSSGPNRPWTPSDLFCVTGECPPDCTMAMEMHGKPRLSQHPRFLSFLICCSPAISRQARHIKQQLSPGSGRCMLKGTYLSLLPSPAQPWFPRPPAATRLQRPAANRQALYHRHIYCAIRSYWLAADRSPTALAHIDTLCIRRRRAVLASIQVQGPPPSPALFRTEAVFCNYAQKLRTLATYSSDMPPLSPGSTSASPTSPGGPSPRSVTRVTLQREHAGGQAKRFLSRKHFT
ncbi:hypothetical protein F5X68DRAFT_43401 [Plectosphaerella plurivora]|uniref:Uncharacterized protein n=1 Tax=Plectosphaerella plurivora TaxID=936078 RepID=A0A9P8V542_9PEZI|nr:hypothetical protein F5X68DRAFT_43401 [Plectosphaerella plurivora]